MQSPLTIWMKIISLFQISLSEEGPSDTSDKRHTLLNLALTHPMLTEIALKELWKSMVSLKPIGGLVTHSYGPIFHDYLDYRDEYDSWVSPSEDSFQEANILQCSSYHIYPMQKTSTLYLKCGITLRSSRPSVLNFLTRRSTNYGKLYPSLCRSIHFVQIYESFTSILMH